MLRQAGIRLLVSAETLQDQRLPGDGRRGRAATCRACEQVIFLGTARLGRAAGAGARRTRPRRTADALAARAAALAFDDPINIQYTSGTTGFPKGATLSPTTTS